MPSSLAASLLAAVPIPLVMIGPDERIAEMNAPAKGLFRTDGAGRHHVTVLRQPELLDAIEAALRTDRSGEARYLEPSEANESTDRKSTRLNSSHYS